MESFLFLHLLCQLFLTPFKVAFPGPTGHNYGSTPFLQQQPVGKESLGPTVPSRCALYRLLLALSTSHHFPRCSLGLPSVPSVALALPRRPPDSLPSCSSLASCFSYFRFLPSSLPAPTPLPHLLLPMAHAPSPLPAPPTIFPRPPHLSALGPAPLSLSIQPAGTLASLVVQDRTSASRMPPKSPMGGSPSPPYLVPFYHHLFSFVFGHHGLSLGQFQNHSLMKEARLGHQAVTNDTHTSPGHTHPSLLLHISVGLTGHSSGLQQREIATTHLRSAGQTLPPGWAHICVVDSKRHWQAGVVIAKRLPDCY